MSTGLAETLQQALVSGSFLSVPLALLGGILAGLNPCCLALYPAVVSSCCAPAVRGRAGAVAGNAAALVVGTVLATTVMGMLAALAGHAVVALGRWPRYALALVPLLMGTHLVGWLRLEVPGRGEAHERLGFAATFGGGVLLALVVGSCSTPVLAAVLAYAAYRGEPLFGAVLLASYGLGTVLPLLGAGVGTARISRKAFAAAPWIERAVGVALISVGLYLLATVD